MSEKALQTAEKRGQVKGKGQKEIYTHLHTEFQRTARRDKKVFLTDQFTETEKNDPCSSSGKKSACNVGGLGSIPELGRSPGEGKDYLFQYSGLENCMDNKVHGITKSWT